MALTQVQNYYESSDRELGRRYITDLPFLSPEYCEAVRQHRYAMYPFLRDFVRFDCWAGKRVLEIGCGHGADLSEFARHGANAIGCDLTYKHCDISRQFTRCVDAPSSVAQASATSLPFAGESFDLAYSCGVLLLLSDLDRAVAEIHRVLRPGGVVIVLFYNRLSLHYYLKTLYYYGVVCDLEQILGARRLIDWFTDGFGYPRTYHQTPASLQAAFDRFQIDDLAVRNFTPEQLPTLDLGTYPPQFRSWLSSRLGFYIMLKAHK